MNTDERRCFHLRLRRKYQCLSALISGSIYPFWFRLRRVRVKIEFQGSKVTSDERTGKEKSKQVSGWFHVSVVRERVRKLVIAKCDVKLGRKTTTSLRLPCELILKCHQRLSFGTDFTDNTDYYCLMFESDLIKVAPGWEHRWLLKNDAKNE